MAACGNEDKDGVGIRSWRLIVEKTSRIVSKPKTVCNYSKRHRMPLIACRGSSSYCSGRVTCADTVSWALPAARRCYKLHHHPALTIIVKRSLPSQALPNLLLFTFYFVLSPEDTGDIPYSFRAYTCYAVFCHHHVRSLDESSAVERCLDDYSTRNNSFQL